jgi:hypothetical protein
MLHKKRLTLTHKRLAVQVANEFKDLDVTDAQVARSAIKKDRRVTGISPDLSSMFVLIVLGVIRYLQARASEQGGTDASIPQTDDEVYLSSLRFQD